MGKTPIYNLMKTIYWYSFYKEKSPFNLLFIHVFSNPQKKRYYNIQHDLEDFADKEFLKEMLDYKQINFPYLYDIRNVEKDVTQTKLKNGKNIEEIKEEFDNICNKLAKTKEEKKDDILNIVNKYQKIYYEKEYGEEELNFKKAMAINQVIESPVRELSTKIINMMEPTN